MHEMLYVNSIELLFKYFGMAEIMERIFDFRATQLLFQVSILVICIPVTAIPVARTIAVPSLGDIKTIKNDAFGLGATLFQSIYGFFDFTNTRHFSSGYQKHRTGDWRDN